MDYNKEFEDFINESESENKIFWSNKYPKYSFQEKVEYWLSDIHNGMRTNGDLYGEPYKEFSKKTYDEWKSKEPKIDEILEEVIPKLGFSFKKDEYLKRIKS